MRFSMLLLLLLSSSSSSSCVDPVRDPVLPRKGVLRTQKLKTHLLRTQSSKILPFKPGAGPYVAIYAAPTARDFFLASFYPSGPFTCIFSKTSPEFFLCWLWLTPVPVWAGRISKTGQPAHRYRQLTQVLVLIARGI